MKLSELLVKPIKVKGGGTLNLKGISKHIVDKEINSKSSGPKFPVGEKILNLFDEDLIAHPSKFALNPEDSDIVADISQIDSLPEELQTLCFLYKKSDIDVVSESKNIIYCINVSSTILQYESNPIENLIKKTYTIDDVPYYALYVGIL